MFELKKGTRLALELADFDACDPYEIEIQSAGDGIRYRWQLGGCNDAGTVEVPNEVLRSGQRVAFLSQGNVDPEEPETALPPFLIARDALAALRKKKPIRLQVSLVTDELELEGKKKVEITVGGKKQTVDALHARGKEIDLVVLDHPDLPLVIKAEWEDENFIELKSIG